MLFPMLFGMRCFNAETETQRDLDVRYKPDAFFHFTSTFGIIGKSFSQSNPVVSSPKSIAEATFTPLSQLFSFLYFLPNPRPVSVTAPFDTREKELHQLNQIDNIADYQLLSLFSLAYHDHLFSNHHIIS
jgi:hypothetical protein